MYLCTASLYLCTTSLYQDCHGDGHRKKSKTGELALETEEERRAKKRIKLIDLISNFFYFQGMSSVAL